MITTSLLLILLIVSVAAAINVTELDCRMRKLALGYARNIQSWRSPDIFREIHDALRLTELCHVEPPRISASSTPNNSTTLPSLCHNRGCIFVNPNTIQKLQDGSILYPVQTIDDALTLSRSSKKPPIIIFRRGIHTLHKTMELDHRDSGLLLLGYPGEYVWLSGGLPLENRVKWNSFSDKVKVTDMSKLLRGKDLPKIASLFTTQHRLIRARYPNSDPETAQWGYASPDRLKYSIAVNEPEGDIVLEWHRPPPGEIPKLEYVDFSKKHPSLPQKNDSTMAGYNLYASGKGGVCADLWGDEANSYWCSNASAGGWSFVDQECSTTGQLQIPVSMTYNQSHPVGRRLKDWKGGGVGGYIYAWHSQSWSMHMFEINASLPGALLFSKGGGRQGGRNWCRCDQCTYAGPWCGQNHDDPTDKRLISGTWLIENVLDELDVPGEFYFDPLSQLLYLYPNTTAFYAPHDLRFAMLETLVSIKGAQNITIENLGFRDSAATFFGEWSAPSGGDWALHRGGAIFLERVDHVRIRDCIFRRLDGNAVFLSGKTRHVTIHRNLFEWIGENAIATWGDTNGWNATEQTQPMYTLVEHNVFRELGIFQKQSSAWGQAKAALSTIRQNIMFNLPRAAINFNDMMGGGDAVLHNLIFNTCRESGDHGPINSWDRQPFLTTLRDGRTPSFIPLMRTIGRNFIFANYGASEGVDNDDGSSWFHVQENVFYASEGFKMDYGGHDSVFEDNLVVSYPTSGQRCIGFGTFFPGHGHIVRGNKCIVPRDNAPLAFFGECSSTTVTVERNSYFSPNGTATIECSHVTHETYSLEKVQQMFGLELGSTVQPTPSVDTIIQWSKELLSSAGLDDEISMSVEYE